MRHLIISILALVPAFAGGSVHASNITCVTKDPEKAWVRKITIDSSTKQVKLEVVSSRTQSSDTLTILDAVLEKSDDTQFGEPIYAFNAYPRQGIEATNLFKLFKGFSEWRLIDAGVVYVGNKPTLRAIGPGQPYDCTKR